MSGYIGITDRQWFNNLKSQYILNEVNFWRKNTNNFKSLAPGEKFFFLVKNDKENRTERKVLGIATFVRYEVMTISEAWKQYKSGNGVNSIEEFYSKMKKLYEVNMEENNIGCIILKDVEFFANEVLLSDLNIDFQNSIVSGKGISEEEVIRIIETANNINIDKLYSNIKEENNNYLTEEKLHYEFWNEFISNSFNDFNFKNSFNKRKSWEKSYYDLFWKIKGVHLYLRHNIRENYAAVEIYVEDNKALYNYLLNQKDEIEKQYGDSLNFTETRGKNGQAGKANKIYVKYNCGEICDRSNWNQYISWLKNTSLKMKEVIENIIEKLGDNNYNIDINNTNDTYSSNKILPYEREVISIPAAGTIDLIYDYKIHAHPNNNKRYPYKKALFYTFREKGGIMNKLYELNKIITLNPNNIASIDTLDIDKYSKERLKGYIEKRKESYTFHEDGEYKFYILNKPIELINKVYLPKQKKHVYFTIKEIYSGKEMINSSNEVAINNRVELFDIIKKNSSVDYIELEKKNLDLDTTIIEGNKVVTIKEVKKRNSLARRLKLDDFREKYGKVYCEVCGIDDELVLDVHHDETKVADMEEGHVTKLEDLRVVCANCHRKIHGLKITVDKLINISKL